MKTKVSPTIVGAFVIGAFVLAVVALFSFGGINFFQKPQRFVVYFDESVHGLDQGSQVKLRGVRVGRVIDLTIRYDPQRNHSVVAVVCEFSKDVISDNRGQPINVADRAELQGLVERGLRARLEVQALATGMLFVGLDFRDPRENPPDPQTTDARYVVVPFVPSAIEEFQASITEILADLKKIDFGGISKGLTTVLTEIPKRLDGVDLKGVTEQWRKTGAQIEALANGPQVKETFENLNGAVSDLRATIARLDAQLEPAGKEVQATLGEARKAVQAFNEAAIAARTFISGQAWVGDELGETMGHLNEAADSVKRLADFLERNPNALLTGRRRPQ
ncbi:MAG: MlaD family protein [Opitutaceae bacterium]